MNRNELFKVIGDVVALILSAALIIATVAAINTRAASASDDIPEANTITGKYVEENSDSAPACEYVLARFEAPDTDSAPCAAEEDVVKLIVPWIHLIDECSEGRVWLVSYEVEEFEASGGCLSAELSL